MEFLPERESRISGIFMFIDGLVIVISPLIFIWISQDLNLLLEISFTLNTISILLFLALRVPESLKFLIIKGKFDDFKQSLKIVQKISGLTDLQMKDTLKFANFYEHHVYEDEPLVINNGN